MIISFTVEGQPGGVHAGDLGMVLASITNGTEAVLYTSTCPDGVTVDQTPHEMLRRWKVAMEEDDRTEVGDE